jgi:alpha-mannosidase
MSEMNSCHFQKPSRSSVGRRMRAWLLLFEVALLVLCALRVAAATKKDVLIIIPHTHWEGAFLKSREEYLEIGLPHIVTALNLLKRYPQYRFVLDQMCYIKPFLERYPTEVSTVRQLLDQQRLEIVGGTDTMHDNNMPSGESIVHQYLLGKWFFRDRLGYEVKTGWGLDTFGHNGQMPQILKLVGIDSYWFQRGVPNAQIPAELIWQGIDGTKIPAYWLPTGYGGIYPAPRVFGDFEPWLLSHFEQLAPFARGRGRVLLDGADVTAPEEHVPALVEQFNSSGDEPFSARFGLPSDYEALMQKNRPDRPVLTGELNPVFQGTYSTRIELKQWMRDLERTLTSGEKAAVLANRLSASDREALNHAWEPVLFNQAHDLTAGTMMDKVYEDTIAGYRHAKSLGDEILDGHLEEVLSRVDTRGSGVPLVIFNLLGWPRSDFAEADVAFSNANVRHLELRDESDEPVAFQILRSQRDDDGGIRIARIGFVAHNIPALGYAVYHVVPTAISTSAPPTGIMTTGHPDRDDIGTLENEFYKVTFNLWTGEITSLLLKESHWEALSGPGNVVAMEEDHGDLWELYGTLNGTRLTAMHRNIGLPQPVNTTRSNDYVGGSGSVSGGRVLVEFHIAHPFGRNHFATRVRMYPGVRRIDIHTEILNQDTFVRYRLLFPTSVRNGKIVHEIPFGAIERPRNQELPAQNWMDYSDDGHGVAILNHGLPGNNVSGDTMMLSLMRSVKLQMDDGNDVDLSGADTALELGKQIVFDYALVPHQGTWQDAEIYRAGLDFNNPLIVRKVSAHTGALPKRWGLLEVSNEHVVVSALRPSRDGDFALRVYEAAGQSAPSVRVDFNVPLATVREANLIEDPGQHVSIRENGFSFDLRPYEIKTFRLHLTEGGRARISGSVNAQISRQ